jgi:hypothetical protein
MANNFHDNTGLFVVGVDGHVGLHFPMPLPVTMFFVSITAVHPFILGADQQPTVLMNGGHPSVQDKHNPKFLWPHIGVFPDPLDMFTPIHCIFGEQQCWLPRLAVHICKKPAAPTAIGGPISVNLDCWEFAKLPTSLVVQVGTVQTTPSPEDYKFGAVRMAVEAAIDVAVFFATGGHKGVAWGPKSLTKVTNQLEGELAQKAVKQVMEDGLEHMGKEGMDNIQNEIMNQAQKHIRDKFMSKLWSQPSGALDWANRARSILQDGTGFNPGDFAAAAATGQPMPDLKLDPVKAIKTAAGKFVPVSGPAINSVELGNHQREVADKLANPPQKAP